MVRLSISEFSTYRWSLEQEVLELSRRGIQNIGIWRAKFSDFDIDHAADLLYRNDLRVSSLSWAGGFTGTCGPSHEDAILDAALAIRTAAKIGAECLIVHPGARGGHTQRHSRRLFRTAIDRLLPVAADYGVTLAMEVMGRDVANDWTVFEDCVESLDFACQYSPQELGIVVDLFHIGNHSAIYERIPELIPRIALVQLADRSKQLTSDCRCQLGIGTGIGTVPVQQWFNQLEDNGYRGLYEVEVFGPLQGEPRYRQLIDDSLTSFQHLHAGSLVTPKRHVINAPL